MIPVIEIVMSLRYELGDMQGLNISDYELIKPINQAVSLLYGTLSERYVHATVKRKPIVIDSTKTYSLPSDFVRVHQVVRDIGEVSVPTSINPPKEASYRIVGTELFADEGEYTLEYYYIPSKVWTLGDYLDVSESMRTWIENIALAMYKIDSRFLNFSTTVIGKVNEPPASPNTGDQYIVDNNPTGAFTGFSNAIARYDGRNWLFIQPSEEGHELLNLSTGEVIILQWIVLDK